MIFLAIASQRVSAGSSPPVKIKSPMLNTDGDGNGALVAAINSVKDTTGVEASIDANGQLLLTSREGRGIKIDGNIGGGAFINANMKENYGRLSLVKNDGKDILISGSNLSSAGFGATQFISQASVSLRESKGARSVPFWNKMEQNKRELVSFFKVV